MSDDIRSVRRAFEILNTISKHSDGINLTDIASLVDLPKSTVARMLSTLLSLNAIERLTDREGFRIGSELVAMSSRVPHSRSLISIAHPYLQQLVNLSNESVTLAIAEGDEMHYIDQINGSQLFHLKDYTGLRFPLHCVSDGKLILAFRPAEQIEAYLSQPMQRFTKNTITDPEKMRKELQTIRENGYSWTNGEYNLDGIGVATPLRDENNQIVASICMFGPAHRFPAQQRAQKYIAMTIDTGHKISAKLKSLGWSGIPR